MISYENIKTREEHCYQHRKVKEEVNSHGADYFPGFFLRVFTLLGHEGRVVVQVEQVSSVTSQVSAIPPCRGMILILPSSWMVSRFRWTVDLSPVDKEHRVDFSAENCENL